MLFNKDGCLHKYSDELEILTEFYSVRLDMYQRRKQWIEAQLQAESNRLNSQARFIKEKIEGKIVIGQCLCVVMVTLCCYCDFTERTKTAQVIEQLKAREFPSDPVKTWRRSYLADREQYEEEGDDYRYLLSMEISSLTEEKEQDLLNKADKKVLNWCENAHME